MNPVREARVQDPDSIADIAVGQERVRSGGEHVGGNVRVGFRVLRPRGVRFLPDVDDDPRTAVVVSEVVLLAGGERIAGRACREPLRA